MLNDDHPYIGNVQADPRLIGVPNVFSPFTQFNSAPRIAMFGHHLAQTMVIDKPEFNKAFTGMEHHLIDYTFNSSKRDHLCEVIAVIPKYREPLINRDVCPQFYAIVLTLDEPNGEQRLDYFTVDRYFMGQNGFGWIPTFANVGLVKPGEIIEKHIPITHSPAVRDDQYCLGANLNTIYGSFPETIEDAFIISESAAAKLTTQQVSQITINCRQDRRPLNLNGNEYEDKFLPSLGSHVRDDGALCAFRPIHWTTCIADGDPEALREPLPFQDDIIYIEPGAKIVDITFNINRAKLNSNNYYEQALQYNVNNTRCWEDIYNTYMKYKGKYKLTPKMSTLVTTSIYRMIAQGTHVPSFQNDEVFRKAARNFDVEGVNGHTVDFMQVVVAYTVPRFVSNGSKLSDLGGAKGVVGKIYPDHAMPVDEYGIRADLWIDASSPVSRNNPGQLYETGVNRINEFVRRKCETVYKVQGSDPAFETLMDWYNDVNPNYAKLIEDNCHNFKDRANVVEDAIADSPKLWIPPFLNSLTPKPDDFWHALKNIKAWATKWDVKPSRVTYKSLQADGSWREFVTESKFSIGSKYVIHLHKLPEIFAPGPAAVNHIGVPTKSTFETKHYPVTVNPYRFGEDELRVMAMDTDINEVTRFQNLFSNSPLGVNTTIQALLTTPDPTRIKRINVSNGDLLRSSAVLKLFHSITATLGIETKNTKTEPFDVPDWLADSIWATDFEKGIDGRISGSDDEERSIKRATAKRGKVQKMIESIDTDSELDSDDEELEETLDLAEDGSAD
jgi:hypothetical protein